jgi:glucosamine--fructose-6-phosphate aminotransferase (isomerizing)
MREPANQMEETMRRQPEDLRRILRDWSPVETATERLRNRRVFVVGTGTSFHAASIGAHYLRLAGLDALAVAAIDAALYGPRPLPGDALLVMSHRATKRYTSQTLARAREDGVETVTVGAIGAGVDVETVEAETSGTFTASHLGALARLAQLASLLGAGLGVLDDVPAAVSAALRTTGPGVRIPARGLEFVGGGPNQWTAAEGALKVREAAHLFTEGLLVEQLIHGPGFALGPRDGLVALDGGGPSADRMDDLIAAVEPLGVDVHRFAHRELGESLSVFPLTVVVQRIALEFSLQKGTDPDHVQPPGWKIGQL